MAYPCFMKCIYFLLPAFLWSCETTSDQTPVKPKHLEDTIFTEAVRETQDIPEDIPNSFPDNSNLTSYEADFSWVSEESNLFSISLEGDELVFWSDTLKQVELSYKLETSITIMNEGPHCDLLDWKHGTTSWEKLDPLKEFDLAKLGYMRFRFQHDPGELTELPFPISDMREIQKEVGGTCGNFWAEHMAACKTPNEYPCAVAISAYIFRVGFKGENEETYTYRFLKIPIAVGC